MTTESALASRRPTVAWIGRARRRPILLGAGGLIALGVALVLGIFFTGLGNNPRVIPSPLIGKPMPAFAGTTLEGGEFSSARVLTSMVVGAGLAVAGTTFQGLLRNPLADPYVLGTASGAALGAAIAVVIPIRVAFLGFGLVHVLAFLGALAAVFTVYRLSRIGGLSPLTSLLLTGYAVGSLLAAGLAMAMYLSGAALRQIFSYLLGSFDASSWSQLAGAVPLVAIGSAFILVRARALNGLLLGEDAAIHLGVDVRRERAILLALASLVTAAAVAVSGLIGFVGLVVPHVVRLIVGPNARVVLPLSALGGAGLLAFADLAARLLSDIPVGVVTAVIGAPFFLFLLRRSRSGYEL